MTVCLGQAITVVVVDNINYNIYGFVYATYLAPRSIHIQNSDCEGSYPAKHN